MSTKWFVGFGSAYGIKLTSSIDDVVWLAPFLTANSSVTARMLNSAVYITVCLVQTIVAQLIANGGRAAVKYLTGGNKNAWTTEKILTVGAGCLLSLYSVKLTYEWIQECREEGEEEESKEEKPKGYDQVSQNEEGIELGNRPPSAVDDQNGNLAEAPAASKGELERTRTLFVIAFIGSVDDLTLFVPMLVGKGFDPVQLMAGAFLAASTIVCFCVFIGLCKPIADCLSKIPLAAIVICFASVLLVRGFFFQ